MVSNGTLFLYTLAWWSCGALINSITKVSSHVGPVCAHRTFCCRCFLWRSHSQFLSASFRSFCHRAASSHAKDVVGFADGPRSLLGGLSAALCITEVGRHFVRRCHFHNGWLSGASHMAEEMEMGSGARHFMPCRTSDPTVAHIRCAVIDVP